MAFFDSQCRLSLCVLEVSCIVHRQFFALMLVLRRTDGRGYITNVNFTSPKTFREFVFDCEVQQQ